MNPSTLLALVALVAAVAALAFYLGRITAPQPKTKPRPQTSVHIARAKLTKLDADGEPVGPSLPLGGREITLHFEAQAVDPGTLSLLTGLPGGRHRAPDPDDTPNLLKPPDRRPEPEWPSDEHTD